MILKTVNESALKLSYLKGKNEDGKDIVKSQRFNNLDVTSPKENLYAVAGALSGLIAFPSTGFIVEEESILAEDQS